MPFKPYRSSLDPETLQAAYEAFDLGWAAISKAQDGCWYAAVGITKTLKGSTNSWTSLRNASPLTP
jgi:hypothetical protein